MHGDETAGVLGGRRHRARAVHQSAEYQPRGLVTCHCPRSARLHRRRREPRLPTVLPHDVSITVFTISSIFKLANCAVFWLDSGKSTAHLYVAHLYTLAKL